MSDDASLPAVRRRRWPRIIALVLLLSVIGGFVFWLVKPQTASATALFEVRREVPSLTINQPGQSGTDQDFEIFKKTQVAMLKTKFLLTSALRNPGIASLSVFAGVRDPEEWLQDHLDLSYPENGELLAISLQGPASQASDLALIVDAVAEAYKREVLGQETDRKLKQRDMLERSLQNLQAQIKRKSEDYLDIAKGMGRPEGGNDVQSQLDIKRLDRVDEELAQLEREQLRIDSGSDGKDSKFVAARMEQLRKRQSELEKNILRRNERSVDLETRGEELKQLQIIANDMNAALEKLDLNAQSPARIRQVQPAVINDGKIARQ
jgi:succinoglycan biosynthesis transport protein ExoP